MRPLGMLAALLAASGSLTSGGAEVVVERPSPGVFMRSGPARSRGPRRKKSVQRLAPARVGGNWKGRQYLSYAEHDRCVRATFGIGIKDERDATYNREMDALIAAR